MDKSASTKLRCFAVYVFIFFICSLASYIIPPPLHLRTVITAVFFTLKNCSALSQSLPKPKMPADVTYIQSKSESTLSKV